MKLTNILAALATAAIAVDAGNTPKKLSVSVDDLPDKVTVGKTYEIKWTINEKAKIYINLEKKGGPPNVTSHNVGALCQGYDKKYDAGSYTYNWTIPKDQDNDGKFAVMISASGVNAYKQSRDHLTSYFDIEPAKKSKRYEA